MLKRRFYILLMLSGISCKHIKYQYLPNGKSVSGSDCTSTTTSISSRSSGFSVWGFLTASVVVATAIGNLVRRHTQFWIGISEKVIQGPAKRFSLGYVIPLYALWGITPPGKNLFARLLLYPERIPICNRSPPKTSTAAITAITITTMTTTRTRTTTTPTRTRTTMST